MQTLEKKYIGSIDLLNCGYSEETADDRGRLYIEVNEDGEYWLCCDDSNGEDTGIGLGPANSKKELIDLAEEDWGHTTADEDLSWDVPFSKM